MDLYIDSPIFEAEMVPLYPPAVLSSFGRTLVVASHHDDELLGCGGTIALLRWMEHDVHVLVMHSGTQTHPNVRHHAVSAPHVVHEQETLMSLAMLGVDGANVTFACLPDVSTLSAETEWFNEAVAWCRAYLAMVEPETIILPWRRDPHAAHRTTFQTIAAAVTSSLNPLRLVEYPIWLWELAAPEDAPTPEKSQAWRVDISRVTHLKQAALAAHRSQTTDVIDDDPPDVRLPPSMLAHFSYPWELFMEWR